MRLDAASAGRLAALALACVDREFPNQPGHVMQRAGGVSRLVRRLPPELPASLLEPARVSDRNDGQLAHLDGLNLSRAWCYFSLARALPDRPLLRKAGERHLETGLAQLASGSYAGEHWLATFAAYALACAGD